MIKILNSIEEIGQYRLPFLVYTPRSRGAYDISVRIHDQKWPTLRFRVKISGKEIRVKQFFLDWFFPGFPKSLLSDFASGYSQIRSRQDENYIMFLGKNYRKYNGASAWVKGTTIEMDSSSGVSDDEYEKLLIDLLSSGPDPGRLEKFQFPDRSHFAKGYGSEWYEDRRIARLDWRRTAQFSLSINGRKFLASGMGYINAEGRHHEIFIFQEDQFTRAIWIEVTSVDIKIDHAFYDVRKGEGFFDTELQLAEDRGILVFRKPLGPAVIRIDLDSLVLTAGFSPGMNLQDVSSFLSDLKNINGILNGISESVPHDVANL